MTVTFARSPRSKLAIINCKLAPSVALPFIGFSRANFFIAAAINISVYTGSGSLSRWSESLDQNPTKSIKIDFFLCSHMSSYFNFTFSYGREDEEVMGLKFCNEAIIALQQIWPRIVGTEPEVLTPLQVRFRE